MERAVAGNRRSATISTFLGNTANTLVVAVQAVVLIPLYIKFIGPRLYGAWLGTGDILVWMQAFDLGLPNLMIQRIGEAHAHGDTELVTEYLATGMVVLGGVAAILWSAAASISRLLPSWMGLIGADARTLRLCFLVAATGSALTVFTNSAVGFSRGVQKTIFLNIMLVGSSVISLGVSLWLVYTGKGLWAIAIGLVIRSAIMALSSGVFVASQLRNGMHRHFRINRGFLREFMTLSPATALGGLAYAAMNQSEAVLAAILIAPEAAVVLSVTRKALDFARSIVDVIGTAAYGSFAHLVASEQRARARHVFAEIVSLRLSIAVALSAAYIAVNRSLVAVWVDPAQYGGYWLTIILAARFIMVGQSYLVNYLYRATGFVLAGSVMLLAESIVRIPSMIVAGSVYGLGGLISVSVITSVIATVIAHSRVQKHLAGFSTPLQARALLLWTGRLSVIATGCIVGAAFMTRSWLNIAIVGGAVAGISIAALLFLDPFLEILKSSLITASARLKQMTLRLRKANPSEYDA